MGEEVHMQTDTTTNAGIQRSLRQCLSNAAFLLYQQGHVLETITIPFRGLDSRALRQLRESSLEWRACQRVLQRGRDVQRAWPPGIDRHGSRATVRHVRRRGGGLRLSTE